MLQQDATIPDAETHGPRVLNGTETAALLPYQDLADGMARVLTEFTAGNVSAPERLALPLGAGGTYLVMPASDSRLAMTKLVTVLPDNPAAGRPAIQGSVTVSSSVTGEPLFIMDGAVVTARRTAALSLLAAQRLGARAEDAVFIVGSGAQARSHMEALAEGIGSRRFSISSRTRERAEKLAAYGRSLGLDAQAVEGAARAARLRESRLFVAATSSSVPVLPADLPAGSLILAVGAFKPSMAEVPAELVGRCAVFVDELQAARGGAGDLIQAAAAGSWTWEDVTELASISTAPPRGQHLLFKSVGHSIFDLAAAHVAASLLAESRRNDEHCR